MSAAIDLRNFAFDESLVRVIMNEDNQPWFVAKDVTRALEYAETSYINNLSNLLKSVPDEWADNKPIIVRSENGVAQVRDMLCLSEQGLYFFVARSDKPAALPFQKWLAGEVLPSLRKTGRYSMPGFSDASGDATLSMAARRLSAQQKVMLMNNATQIARAQDRIEDVTAIWAGLCNTIAGDGCGLPEPDEQAWKDAAVGRFVEECCRFGSGLSVEAKKLHEFYVAWCHRNKLMPVRYQPLMHSIDRQFAGVRLSHNMSDSAPNSLEPVKKVGVAKMSKWPLYAFIVAVLLLLATLVYSVNFAHNQAEEQGGTPKVDIREEEKPLLMGEGRGLALAPPPNAPAVMLPERKADAPAKTEPLLVVRDKREEPEQYQRELENIRRMKA